MKSETIDRWCEWGILGCVLAILVGGPLAFGAVDTITFALIQAFTGLAIVLWGARLWINSPARLLWPPMCWAVVAFALYAVVRYLQADIEYVARQELLRVVVYAFLFLTILNNLHRQESIRIITFVLIFLAMAISGYAIFQFLTNSGRVWTVTETYRHRGSGTYISPNHLGGFLEMILPLALAYSIAGRVKPVVRIVVGYAALVLMAGIAVTVSRGSWIATGLSLLIFFGILMLHRTHRLPAALCFVVLIGAGLYFLPKSQILKARSRIVQNGRLDDDKRFALWRPAIELWRENLWWGVGPGHFDSRFRQVRPEDVQLQPYRVHNDFINTLVDWGIVGGAIVFIAVALLSWGVLRTWRFVRGTPRDLGESKRSNKFAVLVGASAGLLAIFFHSAVDFNMHIPANAILAVTLMAIVTAHLRFATERFWITARPWLKITLGAVIVLGFGYLTSQGWRLSQENWWLEKADQQELASMEQLKMLERAFAAEPKNAETALKIAEVLRRHSQEGGERYDDEANVDYRKKAELARSWFERAAKLDPWNAKAVLGCGWCLDWLGRSSESGPFFTRAEELDPKGYYTLDLIGLHYMETGEFAAARPWFERSLALDTKNNRIGKTYLGIATDRLRQDATNDLNLRLSVPGQ